MCCCFALATGVSDFAEVPGGAKQPAVARQAKLQQLWALPASAWQMAVGKYKYLFVLDKLLGVMWRVLHGLEGCAVICVL